jgi:hypothetical protein
VAKRFITPRLNRLFVDAVQGLITDLNKRHKFQVVNLIKGTCPNCVYDPVKKASTGTFKTGGPQPFTTKVCPVCKNVGTLDTVKAQTVVANVQVGTAPGTTDTYTPQPAGNLKPGFARVKTYAKDKDLVDKASYFLIDGVRYSRHTNPETRGLQTLATCFFYLKKDE